MIWFAVVNWIHTDSDSPYCRATAAGDYMDQAGVKALEGGDTLTHFPERGPSNSC